MVERAVELRSEYQLADAPEWLTYLMGIAGKGVNVVKDAVNSSAGALVPPGVGSGETPLSNVSNPLVTPRSIRRLQWSTDRRQI